MVDQVDEGSHDGTDARALPGERPAPGILAMEQRIAPFRAKHGRIVKLVAAKASPRRAERIAAAKPQAPIAEGEAPSCK